MRIRTGVDLLNYEIVQEQATALGRLGRGLEAALKDLREFDTAHRHAGASRGDLQARRALVTAASQALWIRVVEFQMSLFDGGCRGYRQRGVTGWVTGFEASN